MSTTASIRGPEAGAGRRRRAAGVACFAAALALFGLRAEAELVILTDGSFFKVAAFEATNGEAVLDLAGGGRVRLPIERVERVIDDEVVPEPEEAAAEIEEGAAGFPIRFAEGQRRPATSWGTSSSRPRAAMRSTRSWWSPWCGPSRGSTPARCRTKAPAA